MHSPLRFLSSAIRKRRPVHLTFFVTRRCNARCPFCFYIERKGEPGEAGELSLEEIRGISSSMGDLLWVAFSGGEVYLRRDIADIVRVFYENNRPSIILLPTNGLMPSLIRDRTEEVLRNCPRSVIAVKVSLDGLGARHDALRGAPGSFAKAVETCKALGGLLKRYGNFELGINTVFCSENEDEMPGIIEFVKGMEMIKTHTISLVRGDLGDETWKDIEIDKYIAAAEELERGLKDGSAPIYGFRGARLKAAQDIIQRRLIHRTYREKRQLLPCYAGRLNIVLTETGEVFACESFREEHRLGNARECGLNMEKALEGERAGRVLSSIKKGCFCTHECYMMTNILFNPRLYPAVLREALRIG